MAMATSFFQCLLLFSLLALIHMIIVTPSRAKLSSLKPKTLVLPISKDPSTLQYLTTITQRTPPVAVKLTVDLGGQFLWVDCNVGQYISSTYIPAYCNTTACSVAETFDCRWYCNSPQGPGCNNRTCFLWPDNTVVSWSAYYGEISQDIVSGLRSVSVDGSYPDGPMLSIPSFIFTCSNDASLTFGLAKGVKGMAGLGRTNIALPSQFASHFKLARKFAICLPSETRSYGAVFFGDGPYVLRPGVDVSKSLTFTKLIVNPVTTATSSPNYEPSRPSTEYFIGVKSIKVNDKTVPLNASLLVIDRHGHGGTKISTVDPYTILETTIYNAVLDAFMKALSGDIVRVTPVAPFGACFNSTHIGSTRLGPAVPAIDFVLETERVYWRVHGANSMVRVSEEVLCLGFVDVAKSDRSVLGYMNPRTSIMIGGHQLEDNLLQFDLVRERVGFSSSLLIQQTSCSNFNFTSNKIASY